MKISRGDIYYADLRPVIGSEEDGIRPVLIIQNNTGNKHSKTTIIVPCTNRYIKNKLPTHVSISYMLNEKQIKGTILTEQVKVIDKSRLKEKVFHIDDTIMNDINKALTISILSD